MDRILRQILSDTIAGRAYLAKLDAAKKAKRARHAPSRKARDAKWNDRSVRLATIRGVVFARAHERCEFCSAVLTETWELHHVLSGGGRRNNESPTTCAALCRACHRAYHGGRLLVRYQAEEWARRHGFGDAFAAIQKRIDKVHEARRTDECERRSADLQRVRVRGVRTARLPGDVGGEPGHPAPEVRRRPGGRRRRGPTRG